MVVLVWQQDFVEMHLRAIRLDPIEDASLGDPSDHGVVVLVVLEVLLVEGLEVLDCQDEVELGLLALFWLEAGG